MFPTRPAKVLQAVSKPKDTGMCGGHFKSPSMVFGAPTTLVLQPWALKYSARTAPFVLESSPPMTTRPSSPMAWQTVIEFWNCSSVSILCLPLPSMSNPPVLRKPSMISDEISTKLPLKTPWGPSRKPIIAESLCHRFTLSKMPAMTLWPPGACPPESTTPTFTGLWLASAAPSTSRSNSTAGVSYVCGKRPLIVSASLAEAGTASFLQALGQPSSTAGR
mmetsp:Transcript_25613/g.70418  ORF Transcript_25613/g.70418 Transcript_25613/m.70418 type:complete len:220 (-) Transcript_25613:158-817(-)